MFNLFKNKNEKTEYKFQDPENTACIVCIHVFDRERPILSVTHDLDDGCWQFLCGQDDHDETTAKVISLKEATEIDHSINDLFEMPTGIGADRKTINDKWEPYKLED